MPLAIELAAARVRALSLDQIVDSLHDRFRLLTGGARTAVRRQQTLRASVDWSHALLTEPEQVLFRRLAVFAGGFDLDAAQAVGAQQRGGALSAARPADVCWSTSRWWSPKNDPAAECDTGCWKPCASTRWKSSASPVRPTTYAPGIATTTLATAAELESRGHSGDEQSDALGPRSRSTTYAPRSHGAARIRDLETALRLVIVVAAVVVTGRPHPGGAWPGWTPS